MHPLEMSVEDPQVFIRRNCCAALCCMTSHHGGRPSLLRPGKGRARGGRNANGSGEHMHHLLHMLATCFNLGHPWTILSFTSRLLDTSGNSLKLPPRSRVQANAQPGYWIDKIGHSAVPANVEGSSHAQKAHTLVGTQNSLADWQISANRADLEPWVSPKPQVNTM